MTTGLALWGGFECSVTRIGEVWRDQVRETGHHDRPDDLEQAAALGIGTLRYPLVWERALEDEDGGALPWHDQRIALCRRLRLGVVAGLLHHGSGPAGTHLLDPLFPERLASHAGRMARRYPDIQDWTPVNEPLTTARFSLLYGFWYPHGRETALFLRGTVAQCRAVLLAMRAIRAVIPGARLVQTEDVARTFATPPLAGQARYENDRRWLSLDLLCGRVDRSHEWHARLLDAGVPAAHLDELATGEAAPDVIGANFYVTSERFLDHRTALYPRRLWGGNGSATYADTEAVRVPQPGGALGWIPRLRELWQRYRRPIVISEAHLGCEDEAEQARWFLEAWQSAQTLRAEGTDLRAVTAWALAGAVDWNSLMQQRQRNFECGVWQPGNERRPRLLAELLPVLARGGTLDHPALNAPGWWHGEDRFLPPLARAGTEEASRPRRPAAARPA